MDSATLKRAPTEAELRHAEHDIDAARLLFASNSGADQFQQDIPSADTDPSVMNSVDSAPQCVRDLIAEIGLGVSDITKQRIQRAFLSVMDVKARLIGCASCGRRKMYTQFDDLPLEANLSELAVLRMPAETVAKYEEVPDDLKAGWSVYTARDGTLYHLHAELVSQCDDAMAATGAEPSCFLCSDCACAVDVRQPRPGPRSLAAGVDFGNYERLGLKAPSTLEWYLMSNVRSTGSIVKMVTEGISNPSMQMNAIRGSFISHDHVGPSEVAKVLPNVDAAEAGIQVVFVDSRNKLDQLMPVGLRSAHLGLDVTNLYGWLRALRHLNSEYSGIDIDESEDMLQRLAQLREQLVASANIISDDIGVGMEARSGGDVAGIRDPDAAPASEMPAQSPSGADADGDNSMAGGSAGDAPGGDGGGDDSEQSVPTLDYVWLTRDLGGGVNDQLLASLDVIAKVSRTIDTANPPSECAEGLGASSLFGNGVVGMDGEGDDAESESNTDSDGGSGASSGDADGVRGCNGGDGGPGRAVPEPVRVSRSKEPVNEFTDNKRLLYGSFPHLFMLGRGLSRDAGVSDAEIDHFLHHYTNKFAQDQRFLFTLFDQKRRHKVSQVVAARVKANPESIRTFVEAVNAPGFSDVVDAAKKNPEGKEARKILSIIMPHIKLLGQQVPYGPVERKQASSRLYSLVHRFGLPSLFITISFDDMMSALSIRMSFPNRDNVSFPATADGFLEALMSEQKEYGDVKLDRDSLRKLAMENPVAAAEVFKRMIEAVFSEMIGLPAEHTIKKTTSYKSNGGGLFGNITAAFSVVEAQVSPIVYRDLIAVTKMSSRTLCLVECRGAAHFMRTCVVGAG